MKKQATKDLWRSTTIRTLSVSRTATGGEQIVTQTDTGQLETVITSPSSVAAMDKAVKTYARTLKNLAKR
jgi:hypothetical protein